MVRLWVPSLVILTPPAASHLYCPSLQLIHRVSKLATSSARPRCLPPFAFAPVCAIRSIPHVIHSAGHPPLWVHHLNFPKSTTWFLHSHRRSTALDIPPSGLVMISNLPFTKHIKLYKKSNQSVLPSKYFFSSNFQLPHHQSSAPVYLHKTSSHYYHDFSFIFSLCRNCHPHTPMSAEPRHRPWHDV